MWDRVTLFCIKAQNYICDLSKKYSSLDSYFNQLDEKIGDLISRCESVERKLNDDIKHLNQEVEFYKSMLHTIANTLPDMLWCKDTDGKYMYANTSIKKDLLLDYNVIGKTDIDLSAQAKIKYGNENYTFGEKCANSDEIVKQELKPMRFLESGKIKGKLVYLEVFKAPLIIDDKLIGIVGAGRDLTEYVEAYREHNCANCHKMDDIFKKYEFN